MHSIEFEVLIVQPTLPPVKPKNKRLMQMNFLSHSTLAISVSTVKYVLFNPRKTLPGQFDPRVYFCI